MKELHTLVIYDIEDDRLRTKAADRCLDYGLVRIQYSAFWGPLDANRRQELYLKLKDLLDGEHGRIVVLTVCQDDLAKAVLIETGKYATTPAGARSDPTEQASE